MSFLDLAAINQAPFDDTRLIHLDDKVLLHQLMTWGGAKKSFWPEGYVLPEEMVKLRHHKEEEDNRWVLKDRAGYGSHGNSILQHGDDAMSAITNDATHDEQVLCQKIIDPPLLIHGRRFSLRVYIIYWLGAENDNDMLTYISNEGLAKLASAPYNSNASADANGVEDVVFMTNSGLGEGDDAVQLDFHQLRQEFDKQGWDYDKLWQNIYDNAQSTMRQYREYFKSELAVTDIPSDGPNLSRILHTRAKLPKILGLDFLVDDSQNSWLIEVNRFPGLEPRGPSDETVKRRVVQDAWLVACELADVPPEVVGLCVDHRNSISLSYLKH